MSSYLEIGIPVVTVAIAAIWALLWIRVGGGFDPVEE